MDDLPVLDPLASLRAPGDPFADVYLTGTVFLDIIFTGLDSAPVRGTESWARGMGSSPGGVANMATALARLGLRTTLAAAFGDDVYGDYCWDSLEAGEGIDLGPSRRVPGWHSPVTVSMAYEGERTMVSHGHRAPPPEDSVPTCPVPARAAVASLGRRGESGDGGHRDLAAAGGEHADSGPATDNDEAWIAGAAASGTMIFADVGWDDTGRWDPADLDGLRHCAAFLPNAEEAMRYTRAATPREAARRLADLVPLAVVTLGAEGACAVDSATGQTAEVPALVVETLDPTGAGDVFVAGFVTGTLAQWPLADRLAFASLCAALSVQEFGGSLSAPGWPEIAGWWDQIRGHAGQHTADRETCRRYGFLDALLPAVPRRWPLRRAVPTVGFRAAPR